MKEFLQKFKFIENNYLKVGIERECFLTNIYNNIIPIAEYVLKRLPDKKRYGYELSACQLEDRIGPCNLLDIRKEFTKNEIEIIQVEKELNFQRLFIEVAPKDMPMDIYPNERYKSLVNNMSKDILLSACRVAGLHIHIGMPNRRMALKVYNKVIKELNELCKIGDNSNGERLRLYKIVAPRCIPPVYESWKHFYQEAVYARFNSDPRNCWHLIRISVNGTIEFRTFGTVKSIDKVIEWAEVCHNLCKNAFENT